MVCQQAQAFVAAGLNQGCHQEGIQQAIGFLAADFAAQGGSVGGRGQRSQRHAPLVEPLVDLFKMAEFLLGDRRQGAHQLGVGGIAEH